MSKADMSLIYTWAQVVACNGDAYTPAAPFKPANRMIAAAAGLAAMYWYAGGVPTDVMSLVPAYLVGGVAVYAVAVATNQ